MRHLIFIVLSIFTFISCEQDNPIHNNEYDQYIKGNSIDNEINFYPFELHDSPNSIPNLKLKIFTSEIFPCYNYGISTSEFLKNDELIIRLDNIQDPGVCLTALGPARTLINLPESITKLTFINGQKIDRYQVYITREKITITPINYEFSNSEYEYTFRFPENTFVYVCGTNVQNEYIFSDFKNIILSNDNITEFNFNGDGRIPYPESSDGHWVDNESVFFKYETESDFNELKDLLKNFTQNNIQPNDGVTISLMNWKNESYRSWMMY